MYNFIFGCSRSGNTTDRNSPYYKGQGTREDDRYNPKKYNPYYYEPLSEGRDDLYHY